jgi:hypothetical protein
VPPDAIGSVPVVRADVELAYTAPPDVKLVSPVPPEFVGNVPVVSADVDVAYTAPLAVKLLRFVPPFAVGNTPDTPVVSGSPVPFVRVTAEGVSRFGVISDGDVCNTTLPDPVAVVAPVPPCVTPIVVPFHVPELIVPSAVTLPAASRLTDLSAGYVTNTACTPELKFTGVAALPAYGVVRASVLPLEEYVPRPTSQFAPPWSAIQ